MNTTILYFPTSITGNSTANAEVLVEKLTDDTLQVTTSMVVRLSASSTLDVSFFLPGFYNFKFVNTTLFGTNDNKLAYRIDTPLPLAVNDQLLDVIAFQSSYQLFDPSKTYTSTETFVYAGDSKRYTLVSLPYNPTTYSLQPFTPSTNYVVNDLVYIDFKIYQCTTNHTAGSTIDLTKFSLVLPTSTIFGSIFVPDNTSEVYTHNLNTTNLVLQVVSEQGSIVPIPTNTITPTQVTLYNTGLLGIGRYKLLIFYRSNTIV